MNDTISMDNDGKITLKFINGDFEVRGDFYPPQNGGSSISPDYIRTLLEESRIVYGVNMEEIDKAYKECVEGKNIVKDVLIARGEPMVNETLEYMQLNPLLGQFETPGKDDDTVDHRARSPFIIVKKDQAIAKQKSRKPGKDGINVHGETVSRGVIRPEGVSGGENTRMEGRFLLSNIAGQLIQAKNVLSIRDYLIIKGPVDYKTGNILFPGNVEIDGPVSDGFKIYTGGSLTIKQAFDVTEAVIKENLNVAGGIIGRGRALVKVGGNLRTKFIENCRLACRKSIFVELGIVNSNIFTLENLEMGDKGRIVGGDIFAVKGVRTGAIGKKDGKAAHIHCGVDFTLEQEKEEYNGKLRILAGKLSRLRQLMEEPQASSEKKVKMQALLRRLEEEQQKAQIKVTELLDRLNSYENAIVEVKGEIVWGTTIEICQAVLFVTEPHKNVRIRFDRETRNLIVDKLQQAATP